MLKSPVEGSTLVLLKLNEPAIYSDFVRPACLPDTSVPMENYTYCTTLGWNTNSKLKNFFRIKLKFARATTSNGFYFFVGEQLQRIDVKMTQMAPCENISITTVNSLCAESFYSERDCNVRSLKIVKFKKREKFSRKNYLKNLFLGRRICRKSNVVFIS